MGEYYLTADSLVASRSNSTIRLAITSTDSQPLNQQAQGSSPWEELEESLTQTSHSV